MDCPKCGLANPDSAQKCDCGFDFSRHKKEDIPKIAFAGKKQTNKTALLISIVMLAAGAFILLRARAAHVEANELRGWVVILIGLVLLIINIVKRVVLSRKGAA